MYYKEETLFEQYPLELTDTYKGRGAVFAMTDIGRVYLKEYSGSAVKAEFLAKLLECVNEQGIHTETASCRLRKGNVLQKTRTECPTCCGNGVKEGNVIRQAGMKSYVRQIF